MTRRQFIDRAKKTMMVVGYAAGPLVVFGLFTYAAVRRH